MGRTIITEYVISDINNLKEIRGTDLPKAIASNASFIFEQNDKQPFIKFLNGKNKSTLSVIKSAVRSNAKKVAPDTILTETAVGGQKKKLIKDILKLGPYCYVQQEQQSPIKASCNATPQIITLDDSPPRLTTPAVATPSSNAGTPTPVSSPEASITEPINVISDSPAKQITPADCPPKRK